MVIKLIISDLVEKKMDIIKLGTKRAEDTNRDERPRDTDAEENKQSRDALQAVYGNPPLFLA